MSTNPLDVRSTLVIALRSRGHKRILAGLAFVPLAFVTFIFGFASTFATRSQVRQVAGAKAVDDLGFSADVPLLVGAFAALCMAIAAPLLIWRGMQYLHVATIEQARSLRPSGTR